MHILTGVTSKNFCIILTGNITIREKYILIIKNQVAVGCHISSGLSSSFCLGLQFGVLV